MPPLTTTKFFDVMQLKDKLNNVFVAILAISAALIEMVLDSIFKK